MAPTTMRTKYALTMKQMRNWQTMSIPEKDSIYRKILSKWILIYKLEIEYFYSEVDKHGVYHIHGVISVPYGTRFMSMKNGISPQDTHIDFQYLTSPSIWKDYASKGGINEEWYYNTKILKRPTRFSKFVIYCDESLISV